MVSSSMSSLPSSFVQRKAKILAALAVPDVDYDDLSPKGSVDEGIRDLINEINEVEGWVTTSSCAGRIAVFMEGDKKSHVDFNATTEGERISSSGVQKAGVGGKGAGGEWLFVSHDPVSFNSSQQDIREVLGIPRSEDGEGDGELTTGDSLVHFKFEPMVEWLLLEYDSFAHTRVDPPYPHRVPCTCPAYSKCCPPSWLSGKWCPGSGV
jgi:tRNA wybutosine-synthesizing protein 3